MLRRLAILPIMGVGALLWTGASLTTPAADVVVVQGGGGDGYPTTSPTSTTTSTVPETNPNTLPTTTTAEEKKVTICHLPPGNPANFQVITIGVSALPAHLAHGDIYPVPEGGCPVPPTTTTASPPTTTTTTTLPSTTTTGPVVTPFAIEVAPACPDGTVPLIAITFGNRPDLDGQTGTLTFSTGGSIPLVFNANGTTDVPYPPSAGTGPVTMTYTLGAESVTRSTTFPEACEPPPTTTTTVPGSTTTTSTVPGATTTTTPGATTTAPPTVHPETFTFGAAATVCVREVPTIRIEFQNLFPDLAGVTGTLTMADVNGNVVSVQPLVYEPGTTVDLLYPGTKVNPDGTIADVPGWNLNSAGFWVRDPSDEFLREGINLTYTVNPTATAFVTYPPESSACANPNGPFPPGTPINPLTGLPVTDNLPPAGGPWVPTLIGIGVGALGVGWGLRRRYP